MTEQTCTPSGWRNEGERPLTNEEAVALRSLVRRWHRRAIVAGICTPLAFFLWVCGMAAASDLARSASGFVFAVVMLGPAILMGLCYLWMRDASRRADGLRKDLKRGTVVRYEGCLEPRACEVGVEGRLFREGLLDRDAGEQQNLEILPEAQIVWRVNGAVPEELRFEAEPITLTMAEAAEPEEAHADWRSSALNWLWFLAGWYFLASLMTRTAALPGPAPVRLALGAAMALAFIIAIVGVHEGGHLLAGWCAGLRFVQCQVGPFAILRTVGGLRFGWCGLGGYNTGLVAMAARDASHFRIRDGMLSAGGPMASLTLAAALFLCSEGIWRPSSGLANASEALRMFGILAAVQFLLSAMPMADPDSGFANDGAQFRWVWTDSERRRLMAATSILTAQILAGLRPRDWDANLLDAVSRDPWNSPSPWGAVMRFYHHLDAGRPEPAKAALEVALAARDLPPLRLEMAFYTGLLEGDAANARSHLEAGGEWDGMPDAKRAEAAVLLAEGKAAEARALAEAAIKALKWESGAGLAAAKDEWLRRILGAESPQPLP